MSGYQIETIGTLRRQLTSLRDVFNKTLEGKYHNTKVCAVLIHGLKQLRYEDWRFKYEETWDRFQTLIKQAEDELILNGQVEIDVPEIEGTDN